MELYAAGLNAWNQLRFGDPSLGEGEPDDVRSFTCVLRHQHISRPRPFLSHTLGERPSFPPHDAALFD